MIQNIVICDRCGEKANSCGASYYLYNKYFCSRYKSN